MEDEVERARLAQIEEERQRAINAANAQREATRLRADEEHQQSVAEADRQRNADVEAAEAAASAVSQDYKLQEILC